MVTAASAQLDPLKQLLFTVSGELSSPTQWTPGMLNLVLDLGEPMDAETRATWQEQLNGAIAKCEHDTTTMMAEVRVACGAALQALAGRFYELVEKDYACASMAYEEAASRLGTMPAESWLSLAGGVFARNTPSETIEQEVLEDDVPALERKKAGLERNIESIDIDLCYYQRLPEAGLWDLAGDAYFRTAGGAPDAQRCYKKGLEILEAVNPNLLRFGIARHMLAHVALPYAHLLTGPRAQSEAERLYKKVADAVFFTLEERENEAYQDIIGVIVHGLRSSLTIHDITEPTWWPHVDVPVSEENRECLLKLKTEIGERAFNVLRQDYEKSEEGFAVPETHYLVGIMSALLNHSNQFEKCTKFLECNGTPFNSAFYEWSLDELSEANWPWGLLQFLDNQAYARGRLQQPEYKEFTKTVSQIEESLRRQELIRIRQEKNAAEADRRRVDADEVQSSLSRERPWLKHAANHGAVLSAECVFQLLEKRSWSEVVMGYCSAVEAEAGFVYKEYMAFIVKRFPETLREEAQAPNQGDRSALYFLAKRASAPLGRPVWENFVSSRFAEHKDFLASDLPKSLSQLTPLRNRAAHGEILERSQAIEVRNLVMGTERRKGLLENLVALRGD